MFRSPNDVSSSESASESDSEIEIARVSTNKSPTAETSASPSQHANLITASLLEFHYSVRAAEILNVANQGSPRYDRHSPEAKALAKKMFANGSQLLASHGMLAEDLHSDELRDARQSYLTGIDSLGLGALRETGVLQATPRLALESAGPSGLMLDAANRPGDIFLSNIAHAAIPPVPRLPDASRYATDFAELKVLGRGGFGSVYHVRNFVDSQHYAIKKIGLDPRRLRKRWQKGGQVEIAKVLREIRTLASLEHSNIVRYFGAWIDGPIATSPNGLTELEGSRPPIFRRLLGDKATEAANGGPDTMQTESSTSDEAFPSVYDLGRSPDQAVSSAAYVPESDGIIFGSDSVGGEATTSTISLSNDTDIFTDGDGRGRGPGPESPDHSPNQITLCLQMSLHQLNLATYLSPEPPGRPSPDSPQETEHARHCFHLGPSLSIFLGILSGVQYLHSAGIVHRDLKPANIFLSEDTVLRPGFVDASCLACPQQSSRYLNARIGDFGLVGNIAEELSTAASASDKVVGTELYRPPLPPFPTTRDAKGQRLATTTTITKPKIDEKIDVFALGVLLFELLWPFGTKTERYVVLDGLTKSGTLPVGFGVMVDRTAGSAITRRCSEGEMTQDNNTAADKEQRPQVSESEGSTLAGCIAGMVHGDPSERWDCARVRKCIESVLADCGQLLGRRKTSSSH